MSAAAAAPPSDPDEELTEPLPMFRPATGTQDPPIPAATSSANPNPNPRPGPDEEPAAGRPSPIPDPSARTGTSATRARRGGAGDPAQAARMLAGLLVIVANSVALLLRRRGRLLRQPTPAQLDDVSRPLGRVLVRHLPLEVIAPDLIDVTEAAAAAHGYVLDGPLVEPVASAPSSEDLEPAA